MEDQSNNPIAVENETLPQEVTNPQPAELHAEPTVEQSETGDASNSPVSQAASVTRQQAHAPAKKPASSGTTAAIVGTVIIVLGIAALAVYAYFKTKA